MAPHYVQKKSLAQAALLSGRDFHSFIRQMCFGPGAGSAAVAQTDKVAALLEVTLSWELEATFALLITAAFID